MLQSNNLISSATLITFDLYCFIFKVSPNCHSLKVKIRIWRTAQIRTLLMRLFGRLQHAALANI